MNLRFGIIHQTSNPICYWFGDSVDHHISIIFAWHSTWKYTGNYIQNENGEILGIPTNWEFT